MDNKTFEIRKLASQDLAEFRSLIDLFNRVFEEAHPAFASDTHIQKLLHSQAFIALAAFVENEVVGGLTAYELPMYQKDSSEILLYDLAVKPEFQRRGIGKDLIRHMKDYCSRHGIQEFFVLAHEEDEHAVAFYRATGGKEENVVNFLYESAPAEE
ncbi:MAG TPA: GNAT family N-acetyltransferase [Anaerolineales bacterium]|nr:GNAT family N-acetyltransferase [Anaerolineales bacterium]